MKLDAVVASDEALVASMRVMAGWQADHAFFESGGALIVRGQTRFPTLYANCIIGREPDPEPQTFSTAALSVFSDRHFVVWTRAHADTRLRATIGERGWMPLGSTPAMILESPAPPPPPRPDLTAHRVTSPSDLDDFIAVSAEAYAHLGMREAVVRKLFVRLDAIFLPEIFLVVVRSGEQAVAAAMSIVTGDLAGVYWVGTRPSARGRGAGTLATHIVTQNAFDAGARAVTLQASAEGEPIYRKMGYRTVTSYDRYLVPKVDSTPTPAQST